MVACLIYMNSLFVHIGCEVLRMIVIQHLINRKNKTTMHEYIGNIPSYTEIVKISWSMNWDQYLRQKVDLDILSASIEPKRWKKNKALLRITSRLSTDIVNKQETPNTNAIIIVTWLVIVTWQPTVYINAIRNKKTTKPIINVHKDLNILWHYFLIFLHKDKIFMIRIFCRIICCSFCLETKYLDCEYFSASLVVLLLLSMPLRKNGLCIVSTVTVPPLT